MSSWQDPHQPCAYPLCVELAPGHLSLPAYSAGASGHNRVAPDLNVVLQTAALKLPDLLQEQTSRLSSGHSPRECPHSGGDQLEVTCCRLLGECLRVSGHVWTEGCCVQGPVMLLLFFIFQ